MNDKTLLAAIAQKDGKAFLEFYERYASKLYRQICNGFKDKEAAEDYLQDFWIKIWTDPSFILTDESGSASSFLGCFCLRRISDHYRQKYSYEFIPLQERLFENALQYTHIIEDISVNEITAKIDKMVASFPEKDRNIYQLHNKEHYSVKEIANLVSLSEGTIHNKLSSIKTKLREKLTSMYSIPEYYLIILFILYRY